MWNLFTNIKAMSVSTGFNQARRFVELREKRTASVLQNLQLQNLQLQNLQLQNLQLRNLQLVQRCPLYPPQHRCRQHQRHDPAAPVDRRIGLRHHEHRHRPCLTAMVMVTRMGEHHWHQHHRCLQVTCTPVMRLPPCSCCAAWLLKHRDVSEKNTIISYVQACKWHTSGAYAALLHLFFPAFPEKSRVLCPSPDCLCLGAIVLNLTSACVTVLINDPAMHDTELHTILKTVLIAMHREGEAQHLRDCANIKVNQQLTYPASTATNTALTHACSRTPGDAAFSDSPTTIQSRLIPGHKQGWVGPVYVNYLSLSMLDCQCTHRYQSHTCEAMTRLWARHTSHFITHAYK